MNDTEKTAALVFAMTGMSDESKVGALVLHSLNMERQMRQAERALLRLVDACNVVRVDLRDVSAFAAAVESARAAV